jgi:uncharacterized damage-inducible protein DinB
MTTRELQTLYDYGYWANRRLFEVVSRLTAEQFTETVCGSYGSIRNTLVHVMSAEWGWLERSGGPKRGPKLSAADFPTFASVSERWTDVESKVRGFLAGLRDEDVDREVEFTPGDGPKQTLTVGQMMQHAAIHAVHHRGQVALLLRQLGLAPGDFDILFYYSSCRNQ